MAENTQKATKQVIWGEAGVVKKRMDSALEVYGAVTGRRYFWSKPGQALMMDKRDHDARFRVTKATKKNSGGE